MSVQGHLKKAVLELFTEGKAVVQTVQTVLEPNYGREWVAKVDKLLDQQKALAEEPCVPFSLIKAPGPFVVFVEGGYGPKMKHETLESAKEEAQRLAKKNPGWRVRVYPAPIAEYVAEVVVKAVEV